MKFQKDRVEVDGPRNAGDAPNLIVVQENGKIINHFIHLDRKLIDCNSSDIHRCLVYLLLSYYAFDCSYPKVYGNFLGFMQWYVLEDMSSSFDTSQNFRTFCEFYKSL